MKTRFLAAALPAMLAALGACDHAQPFGAPDLGSNGPFSSAFPRQLTFSPLGDVQPAWLPDGTGIIYSQSQGDLEGDHCLAVLPPEGGHITRTICVAPALGSDSTFALWLPAVSPGGLLAYLRDRSPVESVTPKISELVIASLSVPEPGRVVLRLPYTAPDGILESGMRELHWLHDGSIVYLAGVLSFSYPPYPYDTTFTPNEIDRLDLVGDSARLSVVPGTANATSVATDSAAAMYFSLAGDSRVYRLPDGAPTPSVWYDFGAAGAPSELQVAGDVLIAVVGGVLYRVNVATGSQVAMPLTDSLSVQHVALAPAADRLVVEASRGVAPPDLWLLEVP